MKVSVVIPDWKDPYLINTIDSLLENSELGDDLEVIAVIDGYEPEFELREDPRVVYIHRAKNGGMREAINTGVRAARGEFIMRTDEHCMFGKGYDRIMAEDCPPNAIMTATRYFLDPVKWEKMDIPPVNYEKLVIQNCGEHGFKFAAQPWRSRDEERADKLVDETMGMQGSMWFMPRKWWERVIVNLQTEGYGPLYQDSHEMQFKTWQAGGKLLLTKKTWFAHKHRSFSRTHNDGTKENPANKIAGWKYAIDTWRDYYENEVRPKWKI